MKLLDVRNLFGYAQQADPREEKRRKTKHLKDGQRHFYGGCRDRNTNSFFMPHRTKFKGYMREASRTDRGHGYNKHRIHALR